MLWHPNVKMHGHILRHTNTYGEVYSHISYKCKQIEREKIFSLILFELTEKFLCNLCSICCTASENLSGK